ncbi:MAG: ATP-grasp domain-containing protein [Candidatus Saccharibacteria bacterium]
MKTVLVSGASSVIGYGILRSLRELKDCKLIGTTIYNDSVAQAFCDVFELAPKTDADNYLSWLNKTIKKHNVDIIIPGIEVDAQKWNEHRDELTKTGVKVVLNNSDLIKICTDKWSFYQKLHNQGSKLAIDTRNTGTYESLKQELGLPFLLKPRAGSASRGIVIVKDNQTFDDNSSKLGSELIAQPIVGSEDKEYTTSAFFDNDSKLCCHITLRRNLSKEGFTEKAEVVDMPDIKSAVEELAKIFKPVGPTNFQFRQHEGQLKLLEINPRISSATSLRTGFGYNESVMSIEYFLEGKAPNQPTIKQGRAVRYIEDHFFYDSHNI